MNVSHIEVPTNNTPSFEAATAAPLGALYDCAAHEGDEAWTSLGKVPAAELLATTQWHKFIIAPEIPDLMVPIDYAYQLRAHGLFRLPYREFVIQFGPSDLPAKLFEKTKRPLLNRDNKDFFIATVQQREQTIEGRLFVVGATGVIGSSGKIAWQLSRNENEWFDDFSLKTFLADDPFTDKNEVVTEKILFFFTVHILVGLCSAEGIVDECHRAPKFINKKREAKGKLPLFEYHLLKISPELKMPGHTAAGGTHASPRLHWRRGHIRRLPSGVLTQVRPCLVGNKSLGEIEKDYVVEPGIPVTVVEAEM